MSKVSTIEYNDKYSSNMIDQNNVIEQPASQKQAQQTYAVEEQQQDDMACVMVRDLDSGVSSCVDPFTLQSPSELTTPRKKSAWDDYWSERQNNKHRLLKLVNGNKFDELIDMFKHKAKEIDINEYVYLDGWTLLHHAVSKKFFNVVLVLVQNGCDVNKPTQSMKRTPLHIAVLQKQSQIIQLLLNSKADPNAIDVDFCTPVHYAADFGYLDIFKILLSSQGINFGLRNNKKMTVIDCCRDMRMRDMAKQYCEMHSTEFSQNQYYSRTMDTDKKPIFHVRNRSDFIQKILYENPRLYNSDSCTNQQLEGAVQKQKYVSSTQITLGSKIKNKEKFQRASMIAKQSLCSFRDSLVINIIQSLENYDIFRKLGSGTFGTVFLIRRKQSSKLFALKRLSKKLLTDNKMKKYAYAEREILKTLNHPFILHAHSFFQDASYLYMVMEFCAGGDLQKLVRRRKFQEQKAKKYACEVILALQELHKHNYLFRDLKVSNVLLDQFGHIRLADFGLAKQSEVSHSFLGSVAYLAPQMLVETDNKPHTVAIDWYLLGVFVYEMLVGLPPFYNENRMQMFEHIKKSKPKIPSGVSPECKDFLMKTLAKKQNERLGYNGAFQIKSHSWFKDINWNTVLQKGLQMQKPQVNHKQLRQRQFIEQEQGISQKSQIYTFKDWDYCDG